MSNGELSSTAVTKKQVSPAKEWPSVAEFYTGLDVFVTGGTGFMGKCLLEKLLHSIPDGGKIYILVRPKRGKSTQERIKELCNSKVFTKLLETSPECAQRLVAIEGDISEPGLGIKDEDLELLTNNVSVVFHVAATIRFNEHIKKALQLNVLGVRETANLARKMKKLVSFVHVSTSYAYCNMMEIDEMIYKLPDLDYHDLLHAATWMTNDQLELLTPSLLHGRPNTYNFTKAVAEILLQEEASDLPIGIIRPSIILAAADEPFPGWNDSALGTTGMMIAIGKGLFRTCKIDYDALVDFVPVDYVVNMTIAIGWKTALSSQSTNEHTIYHCTSGLTNSLYWRDALMYMINSYVKNPFNETFAFPIMIKARPFALWPVYNFIFHALPAYLTDFFLIIFGKKARLVNVYKKMNDTLSVLHFYAGLSWQWSFRNYNKLLFAMSKEDKITFNFDMKTINWEKYLETFCMGTKLYVLKEDMSKIEHARRSMRRHRSVLYITGTVSILLVALLVFQFLMLIF